MLVVDDSAVVRQVMKELLGRLSDMTVTVAADPVIALERMRQSRPDVIVLDLEMPRIDGLTFLRTLMASDDPVPVVVCSGHVGAGSRKAIEALDEGAVDIVAKPQLGVRDFLQESAIVLVDTIRAAATARPRSRRPAPPAPRAAATPSPISSRSPLSRGPRPATATPSEVVVAIGASTGGTEALTAVLSALPPDGPGVVVVQHMPEPFTAAFARRLDALCRIEVKEAEAGDAVLRGRALVAPGNRHTTVIRRGDGFVVGVTDGPLVSRHRPSVDVLFQSVARSAGDRAVGVLLTGMGEDGADGLLAMREAGARTVVQDEASCVVFGMPKAAIERGAACEVVPLSQIALRISALARG